MSDAYLNLIKAARAVLSPEAHHTDTKGSLLAAIEAAEKELEAHQRGELNASS